MINPYFSLLTTAEFIQKNSKIIYTAFVVSFFLRVIIYFFLNCNKDVRTMVFNSQFEDWSAKLSFENFYVAAYVTRKVISQVVKFDCINSTLCSR